MAGLSSGGDYAYPLGARGKGVAGVCILNPRTFCIVDLAAVESADSAPPTTPVAEVPRALRGMAERGIDTLLAVSRNDPSVTNVDSHAADAMRALADVPGFRRVDFGSAESHLHADRGPRAADEVAMEHLLDRY